MSTTKLVIKGIEVSAVGNNAKNVECVAQNGTKSNVQSEIDALHNEITSESASLGSEIDAVSAKADTKLPLAGGTMTGNIDFGNKCGITNATDVYLTNIGWLSQVLPAKADINGSPTFNNVAANSYTANAGVNLGGLGVYLYQENGRFYIRENVGGGGYTYHHLPSFSLSGTTLNITY